MAAALTVHRPTAIARTALRRPVLVAVATIPLLVEATRLLVPTLHPVAPRPVAEVLTVAAVTPVVAAVAVTLPVVVAAVATVAAVTTNSADFLQTVLVARS